MSAPNITKWVGVGLLGLPLYGALTFWGLHLPLFTEFSILLAFPETGLPALSTLGNRAKLSQQRRTVWLHPRLAGNYGGLAVKVTRLSVTNVAPCSPVA